MENFIRMAYGNIIGAISIAILLVVTYGVVLYILKNSEADEFLFKIVKKIHLILHIINFFVLCVYLFHYATFNEVPRSKIDNSSLIEGQNNFEERLKDSANLPIK